MISSLIRRTSDPRFMHKFISSFIVTRRCCNALNRSKGASRNLFQKVTRADTLTMGRTIARTCRAFVSSVVTSPVSSMLLIALVLAAIGTQITSIAPRYKNTWMNVRSRDAGSSGRKRPEVIRRRVETLAMFARNTRHRHLLRTCSRTVFSLLSRQRWYSNFRPRFLHKSFSRLRYRERIRVRMRNLRRRLNGITGIPIKLSSRQMSNHLFYK